jgi:hypothetical protein
MSESDFDPQDMEDLRDIFDKIDEDHEVQYVVELHISLLSAKEMIDEWITAMMGDKESIKNCMINYSFIVERVMEKVSEDPDY